MKKHHFLCDCGINKTKPVGRPHPTEVDKDDICIHCGHYAQAKNVSSSKYNIVTDPDDVPIAEDYQVHVDVENLENSNT